MVLSLLAGMAQSTLVWVLGGAVTFGWLLMYQSSLVVWALGPFIDYVATHHRGKAMVVVVLPLSFILKWFLWLRLWFFTKLCPQTSPSQHAKRVARVVADVKRVVATPDHRPMCTARAPWQVRAAVERQRPPFTAPCSTSIRTV